MYTLFGLLTHEYPVFVGAEIRVDRKYTPSRMLYIILVCICIEIRMYERKCYVAKSFLGFRKSDGCLMWYNKLARVVLRLKG